MTMSSTGGGGGGGPYNYSYIFKYIIIGDMGVGKSCLLHQFTEKKCKTDCSSWPFSFIIECFLCDRSHGRLSAHNWSGIWNAYH